MTPRDFIANFDTIAEAPNGIARLRESVLRLAVRGRLVPQNPDDEPATMLLDRISEEKERLVRDKEISKPKHLLPVTDDKVQFSEPDGWAWCRLGSILRHCRNGISASPNDNGFGYPMLRISAATSRQDAVVDLHDHRFADVSPKKVEPYLIEANDLMACRFNGNLHFVGRVAMVPDIIDRKIIHPDKLIKLKAIEISPRYLCYALNAKWTREQIYAVAATTAGNIGINGKQLQNLLIPVPPLAEQHRIVAKADELMDLLDRLEETRRRRENMRTASRDSSLAALRAAGTADEIKIAWMRIAARMDELFTVSNDMTHLREAVIQLAIRGRLVTQDQERTISCSNQLTENRKQTQSFELPSGWTWSNLKRLGRVCGGGTPSKKNPEFWSGDIPWISPKDMKVDFINRSQDMVTIKAIDRSSIKLIPSGALLMVVRGMILDHSFPVAVTEIEVTINQDMKALIPFDSRLSRYLLLLMKGMKMEILKLVKKSTHGTCRLTTDDLFSIVLPIPPVEEQQRVLSKVDDIMNVLDQLNLRLTAQRNAHDAFATSFLHHLST